MHPDITCAALKLGLKGKLMKKKVGFSFSPPVLLYNVHGCGHRMSNGENYWMDLEKHGTLFGFWPDTWTGVHPCLVKICRGLEHLEKLDEKFRYKFKIVNVSDSHSTESCPLKQKDKSHPINRTIKAGEQLLVSES